MSQGRIDLELRHAVTEELEWEPSIALAIDRGVVTLAGEVEWRYQRDEAEADMRKLSGVRDVVNMISVRPRPSAEDLQLRIRKALERSAEVEARRVQVDTVDGKVVLTGKVSAWTERETAERAAWAAPGVVEVENRIEIGHG